MRSEDLSSTAIIIIKFIKFACFIRECCVACAFNYTPTPTCCARCGFVRFAGVFGVARVRIPRIIQSSGLAFRGSGGAPESRCETVTLAVPPALFERPRRVPPRVGRFVVWLHGAPPSCARVRAPLRWRTDRRRNREVCTIARASHAPTLPPSARGRTDDRVRNEVARARFQSIL